ncbi:MAG: trehalose-6-phosphate synthase, partial [Planctomycetota bacterium]
MVESPSIHRTTQFVFALVLGLALLTWGAAVLVQRTTNAWFETDLSLRAELALDGGRQELIAHWNKELPQGLQGVLEEIKQDERLVGAAAWASDGSVLARTAGFPEQISYRVLGAGGLSPQDSAGEESKQVISLPQGKLHVSALPLAEGSRILGTVILIQDFAFAERREAEASRFILLAIGLLALAASAVTVLVAQLSWRGWLSELRRFLAGGTPRTEFQPIMRDVRALVERLVSEEQAESGSGSWTAERLKQTLNRHLHGEKIVILANREPYIHQRTPEGGISVLHPASGLVTALEPVMRACSGTWVAHGSGSADRDTVDRHDRVAVPPGEESYQLRRVWLTPEEEQGYYY